jgi:hypothetical protein
MRIEVILSLAAALSLPVHAKTFQNSYVSFEVPDNWTCLQEGVAWTCTPRDPLQAKEAVIVLASKVAGPEDNLVNFLNYLKQPKKIATKVGTPMPSQVMYAQKRVLAGGEWIQAQHLGSEIQDFYTLYLATVRNQLAILASFSAERNRFQAYNPVFDKAIKTLKIVASKELLMPKNKYGNEQQIGIQAPGGALSPDDLQPPPLKKKPATGLFLLLIVLGVVIAGGAYYLTGSGGRKKKNDKTRIRPARPK